MQKSCRWFSSSIVEAMNGNYRKANMLPEPFNSAAIYLANHARDFLKYMCVGDIGKVVSMVEENNYINENALFVMERVWGCLIVDVTDGAVTLDKNFLSSVLELYLTGAVMLCAYSHEELFGDEPMGAVKEKAELVAIKHNRWYNTKSPDGLSVLPIDPQTVMERYNTLQSRGNILFT